MSLMEACGWSLLRGLILATAGLPVCHMLATFLANRRGVQRQLSWLILLAPFLCPALIVGYAYSNFSLSLVHHPVANEFLYAMLAFMAVVPVGTLAVYFSPPPPISAEALHCRRLAIPAEVSGIARITTMAGFWIRGPFRSLLPAWAVMFLVVFQEFEIASLMWCTSWTVWLFDAQAGGLALSESLRFAVLPVCCEAVLLLPVVWLIWKSHSLPSGWEPSRHSQSTGTRWASVVYLVLALLGVCLIPTFTLLRGAIAGLAVLPRNIAFLNEIMTALAYSGTAGLLAYAIVAGILRVKTHQQFRRCLSLSVALPGLFGSLIVSLTLLFVFQRQFANPLYDTPIPLLSALILFLLPRVFLLQLLLFALDPAYSWRLAEILNLSGNAHQRKAGRQLLWQLRSRGRFLAAALSCWWAYWDLTAASILRPTGMPPAPVRLYNFIHYGRATGLSAMVAAAVVVPVCCWVVVAASRPVWYRLLTR